MLCAAALLLLAALSAAAAAQPHIVLILADDLGWHDVGYHGSDISTPALDEMAGSGVKLDNYYVQPTCSASRSQLLTGRYQIHTGNTHGLLRADRPEAVPLDVPLLPAQLKRAGYATHMVGKWHLGHYTQDFMPTNRGFDSFFGSLGGRGDHYNHTRCLQYEGRTSCGLDLYEDLSPAQGVTEYSTTLYTNRALQILHQHDQRQPLFLYLPYQAPHSPLQVPTAYEEMYSHISDPARRKYAGMVTCLDDAVRNISDALKATGMWDNTLFLFFSDNGADETSGGSNVPLRGHKGYLFEGGVRAVGLLHGGVAEALSNRMGTTSHDLIHVSDWFPTLVRLAGGDASGLKLDGHDVWDTLCAGVAGPRTEILHNIDVLYPPRGENLYPDIFDIRVRAAIRLGDWKLLTGSPDTERKKSSRKERGKKGRTRRTAFNAGHENDNAVSPNRGTRSNVIPSTKPPPLRIGPYRMPEEPEDKNLWLFNLRTDPNETTEVSARHPDIVEMLLHRLAHYLSTAVPPVEPCPDPRSNPKLNGGVWGPWLAAGQENSVKPICDDLVARYQQAGYTPPDEYHYGQNEGPGAVLLVFIILILCFILFMSILCGRKFFLKRKMKVKRELIINQDPE